MIFSLSINVYKKARLVGEAVWASPDWLKTAHIFRSRSFITVMIDEVELVTLYSIRSTALTSHHDTQVALCTTNLAINAMVFPSSDTIFLERM
jgi:hypothetical protein